MEAGDLDGRRCIDCGAWTASDVPCHRCGTAPPAVDWASVRRSMAAPQKPPRLRGSWLVDLLDRVGGGGFGGSDLIFPYVVSVLLVVWGLNELPGFLALVVSAAVLAIVPAGIAKSQGRNPASWWLYGFWLLPIAVGHAVVLRGSDDDRWVKALVAVAAVGLIYTPVVVIVVV